MALLHFNKLPVVDINSGFVFKNLFIVDILSDKISDKEKTIISNNLRKITSDTITLSVNYEDNKIVPFGILNKLKESDFDISLTLHTKNDTNIGKFIIKNCSIKYDFKDIIDFDWMKDNDILEYFEVKYSYTDIIYSDVDNSDKIDNCFIINETLDEKLIENILNYDKKMSNQGYFDNIISKATEDINDKDEIITVDNKNEINKKTENIDHDLSSCLIESTLYTSGITFKSKNEILLENRISELEKQIDANNELLDTILNKISL